VSVPTLSDARVRCPHDAPPTHCAACHDSLAESHGWCGNCRVALCLACGRDHFCTAACPSRGCLAGLCVREVRDGVLSERWGLPAAS